MDFDFKKIMEQAKLVQDQMQNTTKELAQVEVVGESGGGLVSVTMTGRFTVKRVKIDPSLFKEEKEILEDLIKAATNDATAKVEKTTREKMSALSSELDLPPEISGTSDEDE